MTLLKRSLTKPSLYGYCNKYQQEITEAMYRNRNCWKGNKKNNETRYGCKYRELEIPITEIITTKNNIPILRSKRRD